MLIAILLIGLVFTSGCVYIFEKEVPSPEVAVQNCIELCEGSTLDLNASPCLSNDLLGNGTWVCDVAHSPRQDIDNLPENQCSAWREGLAKHFVELDPNCKLIKAH